jgi:8-oxo-dGTP pyrophosphatase MutT (NUDIX family)
VAEEQHIHSLSRLIVLSDDHILLTEAHKNDGSPFFFLPGGHVEYGESLREAAVRELNEEAGIEASRVGEMKLVGVYEHTWDNHGNPYHEIAFVSSCEVEGLHKSIPVNSKESHLSFHWKPIDALSELNILPMDFRTLIPQWIKDPVEADRFHASRFPDGLDTKIGPRTGPALDEARNSKGKKTLTP